MRTKKTQEN